MKLLEEFRVTQLVSGYKCILLKTKIMKITIILLVAVCLVIIACQQENLSSQSTLTTALHASKTTVAKNEPVSISITNMPSGNNYTRWSSAPTPGATFSTIYTNSAQGTTVTFSQAGEYEIMGDLRTVHPSCQPSPGWDTCYTTKPSLERPKLKITVTN
jgi:hypothetical protein